MFAADEMLGTGGTPCDLSCCGIKLQVQNAVHMFSIFRITARGFFPICAYILWITLQVFVGFFQHVFPFWQTSKFLLIAYFCVVMLLILRSALCRHLHFSIYKLIEPSVISVFFVSWCSFSSGIQSSSLLGFFSY